MAVAVTREVGFSLKTVILDSEGRSGDQCQGRATWPHSTPLLHTRISYVWHFITQVAIDKPALLEAAKATVGCKAAAKRAHFLQQHRPVSGQEREGGRA